MTRKDYINIAAAILATQERIRTEFGQGPIYQDGGVREQEQLRGVRRTAAHLADALKADNPQHFDPVMFLRNCGYPVGPFVTDVAGSEQSAAKLDGTPASVVWERDA